MQRIEPFNTSRQTRFNKSRTHHDDAIVMSKRLGIAVHYTGDCNGFDHGGYFYRMPRNDHDFIAYVEIGDPSAWGGNDIDPRDRFVERGSIGSHNTWAEVLEYNRKEIAEAYNIDPVDVTLLYVVETLLIGGDLVGVWKGHDGAMLVRYDRTSDRDMHHDDTCIKAKAWTENQLSNAIASWLD